MTESTFKMGRKRPYARRMRLSLRNYIKTEMPTPPDSTNYAEKAKDCLDQVLLNDSLSCCTAAAAFHVESVLRGNAGIPVKFSNAQVVDFYSRSTGYVEGKPETDQGGNEVDVLDCWREHGLYKDGHNIIGHLAVDATNPVEIKTAIWLFENVYAGASMPDAWVNPMPAAPGFLWDLAGNPVDDNGHAFPGVDYDSRKVTICTWGMLGGITYPALARYMVSANGGELHTILSRDSIIKASSKAPNGLDWASLVQDFTAMGGNVPS